MRHACLIRPRRMQLARRPPSTTPLCFSRNVDGEEKRPSVTAAGAVPGPAIITVQTLECNSQRRGNDASQSSRVSRSSSLSSRRTTDRVPDLARTTAHSCYTTQIRGMPVTGSSAFMRQQSQVVRPPNACDVSSPCASRRPRRRLNGVPCATQPFRSAEQASPHASLARSPTSPANCRYAGGKAFWFSRTGTRIRIAVGSLRNAREERGSTTASGVRGAQGWQ